MDSYLLKKGKKEVPIEFKWCGNKKKQGHS